MRRLCALFLFATTLTATASPTIEGYWQDIAGRIVFKHNALPADKYGDWFERPLNATYPHAKRISRAGPSFEITDLLYDAREYRVEVLRADAQRIDFVRAATWSPCRMNHVCRLGGDEMLCELEYVCRVGGRDLVDWRGEERYVRRQACEQVGRQEAQGIPVRCR